MGHLVNVSFAETSADRFISQFILDSIDANGFLSARIWLTLPSSLLHNPEGDRRFVRFATGLEGSIYAGLESLTESILGREWKRDDGAAMKIGRCLIDANWGHSTNVVYQFSRQSPHASILLPSHGRFVGASSNPSANTNAGPAIASDSTGESPRSTASEPSATSSTIRTGGSPSRTLASPSPWATEAAFPSSETAPSNTAYSPSRSPPSIL